jgi:hypothetical protein
MLEVFKQLNIRGKPKQLSELVAQVTRDPAAGWHRNSDREPPNVPALSAGYDIAVFRWEGGQTAPAANLFIKGSGDSLKLTNIVPIDVPELSRSQYNLILDDFVSRNISGRIEELQLDIEITPDHLPITHWLTSDAARLLTTFSNSANRFMPHSNDTQRWRAFLIKAHVDKTTLDTDTLFRWLTEKEKWPEDRAESLVIEYDFALALLDDYDNQRQQ